MTIYFPDVSSFQAGIPLKGALAVICKATENTGYVNPDYAPAKARAAASGTYFCAYHFLHAGHAAEQAAHAFSVAAKTPLMVDFEPTQGSSPQLADAQAFIDAYRKAGGVTHLLYLPQWYWKQLGSPSLQPFTVRGMMLVSSDYTAYTDADTGAGWQPYGGMTPAVWQYTSSLQFNGMSVDFNAFRGTYAGKEDPASVAACLAQFRQMAETGSYGAAPPPRNQAGTVHSLTTGGNADVTSADGGHTWKPGPSRAGFTWQTGIVHSATTNASAMVVSSDGGGTWHYAGTPQT